MKKEDKILAVESLSALIQQYGNFYLTDVTGLNAEKTSNLRRLCFKSNVKMLVVKNTLMRLALQQQNNPAYDELMTSLKGSTAVLFAESANAPAKLLKEFTKDDRKEAAKTGAAVYPELKAAFVQESAYVGAHNLEMLVNIKSKEELLGELIAMLGAPIQGVISGLEGAAGGTLHGLLKTMEEKNQ